MWLLLAGCARHGIEWAGGGSALVTLDVPEGQLEAEVDGVPIATMESLWDADDTEEARYNLVESVWEELGIGGAAYGRSTTGSSPEERLVVLVELPDLARGPGDPAWLTLYREFDADLFYLELHHAVVDGRYAKRRTAWTSQFEGWTTPWDPDALSGEARFTPDWDGEPLGAVSLTVDLDETELAFTHLDRGPICLIGCDPGVSW